MPMTAYHVRESLCGYSTPIDLSHEPRPTCWMSFMPWPATPLTPPSPPSHHNIIVPSSSARCFACSHMAKPISRSQVRAGARINAGRDSRFEKGLGSVKSRQIDVVTGIGRVWFGEDDQSVLFMPRGGGSSIVNISGGASEWVSEKDSATIIDN